MDDDALDDAEVVGVSLDPISLRLDDSSQGVRLDKALSVLLPQFSRGRIQQWIEEGRVLVDGKPAKVRSLMLGVETISVQPQPAEQAHAYAPEPVPLTVVHEDSSIIVLNKPVGLVVHPAAGNWSGTLLNGLLHRWPELEGVPRAGIVHRLDKDTSGLLVVARTLVAQTDLVRQLQEAGQFEKCCNTSTMHGRQCDIADQFVAYRQCCENAAIIHHRLHAEEACEGRAGENGGDVDWRAHFASRRLRLKAACAVATGSSGETSHASARTKAMERVAL